MPNPIPACRLLIIEDDADTADLLRDVLCDHFKTDCVRAVGSIADALQADLKSVDLVLCDFNLPDGTGIDAIRAILAVHPDLPIIMVTGQNEVSIAVKAIAAGAYDYLVKSPLFLDAIPLTVQKNLAVWRTKQENARLQIQLRESMTKVQESNEILSAMVARLEEMALTDSLTGLANRRHFTETLGRMFAESVRYRTDLSCMMIDLDRFKQFNDAHGHQVGDELLETAGRIIAVNCREADLAARYGGDEFVLLLPQTDRDTAANLAARLSREFQAAAVLRLPAGAGPGMSVGIACTTVSRPLSGQQLVSHADVALYAAKQAGRGNTMLCQPDGKSAVLAQDALPTAH